MVNDLEIELLPELAALAERSVGARAELCQALNDGGNLATFEIDRAATHEAGHLVVHCQPMDRLHCVVAAMRARDRVENGISESHDLNP